MFNQLVSTAFVGRQRLLLLMFCWLFAWVGGSSAQSISGQVRTELGVGIADATVTLTRAGVTLSTFTNSSGNFSFSGLNDGQKYDLCISKNQDPLNGVSTFDLQLLLQHILNMPPLDSPYKIIAGQTDPTPPIEQPDVGDVLQLRLLILGNLSELPVPSWKFIPADFVFPVPTAPYTPPPFPEGCKMVTVSGNTTGQDFIGTKTGDLNNNAIAN